MASVVGTLGGVMMLMLIVLFAMILPAELARGPAGRESAARIWLQWCIHCAMALGLLAAVCLAFSLSHATTDPFNYLTLFEKTPYWTETDWFWLYTDWGEMLRAGCFPLTWAVYRGLSALLLGAHEHAQIALGLMCGGFSLLALGKTYKGGHAWLLCFPGSVMLLVPGSFSLFLALWMLSLVLRSRGMRRTGLAAAIASLLAHPFGAAVLLGIALERLTRKKVVGGLVTGCLMAMIACVGILLGTKSLLWGLAPSAAVLTAPVAERFRDKSWFPAAVALLGTLNGLTAVLLL